MTQLIIEQLKRQHFINNLYSNFYEIVDGFESNGLDLSNFGNTLGRFLIQECDNGIKGFEIDDFLNGFKHGITKI